MNNEKYDKYTYNNNYNKHHYKNIAINIKNEDAEKILNYCKDMNISQTKFLVNCAKYVIDNDLLDEIMHK